MMEERDSLDPAKPIQPPTEQTNLLDGKIQIGPISNSDNREKQNYTRNKKYSNPESFSLKISKNESFNGSSGPLMHTRPSHQVRYQRNMPDNPGNPKHRQIWRKNGDKTESPRRVVSFSKSPGPNITLSSLSNMPNISDNHIDSISERTDRRSSTSTNQRNPQQNYSKQHNLHRSENRADRKQYSDDNNHAVMDRSFEDVKEKPNSSSRGNTNSPPEAALNASKDSTENVSIGKISHASTNSIDNATPCINITSNTQCNAMTIEKQKTPYTLQQLFFDIETPDSGYIRLLFYGDIIPTSHKKPSSNNAQHFDKDHDTAIHLFSEKFCRDHRMVDLIDSLAYHIRESVKIHQELIK